MQYSDYLQSDHWQQTRNKKLKERSFCCICKSFNNLHIHHKRYKYDEKSKLAKRLGSGSILFRERKSDLMVFCNSCHSLWHKYIQPKQKKFNKLKLRIKSLMEFGVDKKMAFYIVGHNGMWESLWARIKNGELKSHLN